MAPKKELGDAVLRKKQGAFQEHRKFWNILFISSIYLLCMEAKKGPRVLGTSWCWWRSLGA